MRAVPGVNEDLVVGVSLSLHLFGAVGPWGLRFAAGRSTTNSVHKTKQPHRGPESQAEIGHFSPDRPTCQTWEGWCLDHRGGRATETRRCLCSQTRCGETARGEPNNNEIRLSEIIHVGRLIHTIHKLYGITVTRRDDANRLYGQHWVTYKLFHSLKGLFSLTHCSAIVHHL